MPQTEAMPVSSSTVVVGLTKVKVVVWPSVTAIVYAPTDPAPVITIAFTVVVVQGSSIVTVNSTLSDAALGANTAYAAPKKLLFLVTMTVFCTETT